MGVIHAYFDESGTHEGSRVMCVAGYLFAANDAKRFNDAWGAALRQAGLPYFRMSECAGGGGQFKDWAPKRRAALAKTLIALIRRRMMHGFAVSMSPAEYAATAPPGWAELYGGAYTVCLEMALVQIGKWARRTQYKGRIAYFFEAGHRLQGQANAEMNSLATKPLQCEAVRYASHTFTSKDAVRPFDAADYLAWHYHKLHTDTVLRRGAANQRPMRKDLAALLDGHDHRYSAWQLTGQMLRDMYGSQPVLAERP